jgi:hypothetical protein
MHYMLVSQAVEVTSMDDNRANSNRTFVPTAEVRAARSLRFESSANPQTRLFWD